MSNDSKKFRNGFLGGIIIGIIVGVLAGYVAYDLLAPRQQRTAFDACMDHCVVSRGGSTWTNPQGPNDRLL